MEIISTRNAPQAFGPYSQGIRAGGFVYCSGQLGADPVTGKLVVNDAAGQMAQAIDNLAAILTAAGSSLSRVTKTTVFLRDISDFAAVNAVYAERFGQAKPARSCVAATLPKGALVEIEAIAEA